MDGPTMHATLALPVLALVCWTLVMWVWMYATRIPAIQRAGLDPAKVKQASDLEVLPMSVRQIADNYNHLHEQPTVFYALVFVAIVTGTGDGVTAALSWAYVGLRVIHSLFQALVNFVPVRFGLFVLASLPLFVLAGRQALVLLG